MKKAPVITICGNTRFKEDILKAECRLTFEGWVVLSYPFFGTTISSVVLPDEISALVSQIHKQKIDMSEAIYVVNKEGYVGESTIKEINYALLTGKAVMFMEDHI